MPAKANANGTGGGGRWALLLLFAAGLVNFFDRSSLGIAATSVRAELHLSAVQIGSLLSAFSFAYGLAQLPLAAWLRPANARRALGFGLLLWSLAQAASGLVRGLGSFLVCRVVLGAGESPFYPAGVFLVREVTPPDRRGRGTALLNLAAQLGLAVAPPILTVAMLHLGWRGMFLALGGAGVVLSALWLLLPAHKRSAPATEQEAPLPLASLLREPTMWGMMLGFGGLNYVHWFFIAWLPGYLETGRGLSVRSSGWLMAAPFLAGACGALMSGLIADARTSHGVRRDRVHRTNLIAGLLLCAIATLLVERAHSVGLAVLLVSASLFCLQYAGTSGWGLVQCMAPVRSVAAASALQNFGSFMLASLAPVLTGWLLDRTHAFGAAFLVCGIMAGLGSLCYATLTLRPFLEGQDL